MWALNEKLNGTHSSTNTQWNSEGKCVHVLCNSRQGFTQLQARHAAAMLNNLYSKKLNTEQKLAF